jgi:hypothetical protein
MPIERKVVFTCDSSKYHYSSKTSQDGSTWLAVLVDGNHIKVFKVADLTPSELDTEGMNFFHAADCLESWIQEHFFPIEVEAVQPAVEVPKPARLEYSEPGPATEF